MGVGGSQDVVVMAMTLVQISRPHAGRILARGSGGRKGDLMTETVIWGDVVAPREVFPGAEIVVRDGIICELNRKPTRRHASFVWREGWIFPGLIDLHMHGIGGHDTMDGDQRSFEEMERLWAEKGTTGFLATTMAAPDAALLPVLRELAQYRRRSRALLGVHMEGPYIHPGRRGAQSRHAIRLPDVTELSRYTEVLSGGLKRITVAPELKGARELMAYARSQGIAVSAGHSNATWREASEAFESGIRQVTHLFNAMTGLDHREPGLALAALRDSRVVVELIVDGVHLHPEMVAWVRDLKDPDGVLLVTDAMRACAMEDGVYDLGGQPMTVKDGIARTQEGRLAGSTLTLLDAVMRYHRITRAGLPEAVRAASGVPASMLGCIRERGAIAVGLQADLLAVSSDGQNRRTWQKGEIVYDGVG